MSLWAVLITGLLAGGASCAAVQGGLLTGLLARKRQAETPAHVDVNNFNKNKNKAKRGATAVQPPPPKPSFSEDAVPVAGFLVGKLVSHMILGALLGLLGSALQVGIETQAVIQIGAAALMFILALNIFGVKWAQQAVPSMPASWARLVRKSSKMQNGGAPALLGVSTVLIPCGVTLSMELLAVASGSPVAGAAIMGTFVIGTAPIFAVLGYAARKSATAFRGKLAVLSGVAVVVSALASLNSGLTLLDSPVSLAGIRSAVSTNDSTDSSAPERSSASPRSSAVSTSADGSQVININVKDTSYSPKSVQVQSGIPTQLTLNTKNVRGCTLGFVMRSVGVQRNLPTTGATTIELGVLEPGTYRYTCSMGMYSGSIVAV